MTLPTGGNGDVIILSAAERGKAGRLAELSRAGLPVPHGWVITRGPFRAVAAAVGPGPIPHALICAEVKNFLGAITTAAAAAPVPSIPASRAARFVVRSSTSLEDTPHSAAPGLFHSQLNVTGDAIAPAVRAVWQSTAAPPVWAYLAARGRSFADLDCEVIVHSQVPDIVARGTAYRFANGDIVIEGWDRDHQPFNTAPYRTAIGRLTTSAADAIRAADGADVEWVLGEAGLWIVQARPLPPRRAVPRPPRVAFAFSRTDPERVWTWDVKHNPAPLSPAQAGLVEIANSLGTAEELRTVEGYLYSSPRANNPRSPNIDPRTVAAELANDLGPRMDQALSTACSVGTLEAAIDGFATVYKIYTAYLSPAVGVARHQLIQLVATLDHAVDAQRAAAHLLDVASPARLENMGPEQLADVVHSLAPAWDIACPTYGEHLTVRQFIDKRPRRASPPRGKASAAALRYRHPAHSDDINSAIAAARTAVDIGERDDHYFARAHWIVRHAVLRLAHRWNIPEDMLFWLPLTEVIAASRDDLPLVAGAIAERVGAARDQFRAQSQRTMPVRFQNGAPQWPHPAGDGEILRGRGSGGHAYGVVSRYQFGGDALVPVAGSILVTQTVTPAMTLFLFQAAGVVIEHGGLLDHGPAMARELGIPCIVGCRGAWDALTTGQHVWMDGDSGVVIPGRAAGP